MRTLLGRALRGARRRFYNLGGPWYRARVFELFGSRRYSSPALFGMDRKLAELMPWRDGTFVEAGAHDGYTQSNTYYLERELGWSGLLVEAIPELERKARRRRPRSQVLGCALVGPGHQGDTVAVSFGDLMSSIGGEEHARGGLAVTGRRGYSVAAPARTLASVLGESGLEGIDLLVLDVEGHELEVLSGADWDRHAAPRYLLIEALDRERQQAELDRALGPRYEPLPALSEYDLLYRRRE
jgi:FkbM family methyltransferase